MFVFTCARDLSESKTSSIDSISLLDYSIGEESSAYIAPFDEDGIYEASGAMKDLLVTSDEMRTWKMMFGEYRKKECTREDFTPFVKFISGWTRFIGADECKHTLRELMDHRKYFFRFVSSRRGQLSNDDMRLAHELYDSFLDLFDVGDRGCVFISNTIRTKKRSNRSKSHD